MYMGLRVKNITNLGGFSINSDTNQAVQLHNIVRSLKFKIQLEETSNYLWSENKGADQLCTYYTADLSL